MKGEKTFHGDFPFRVYKIPERICGQSGLSSVFYNIRSERFNKRNQDLPEGTSAR